MTLTLDLPPETERRLAERARREGLAVADYVERAVARDLDAEPGGPFVPLREAFADIDADEGDVDPEAAQREWDQFKRDFNATRRANGEREPFREED